MRPIAALSVLALALPLAAQEPKLPDAKAFDKLVVDTLRDVHNKGADLYNTRKDFEGTYRLYQGALVTVRPLLAHHAAAQKIIDEGLAAAEKETTVAQKAFRLHEAIEAVRAHLKGDTAKKPQDKKPEEKKPEVKKPGEKKPPETKPEEKKPEKPSTTANIRGKVRMEGHALTAGEVVFVSLDKSKPIVVRVPILSDGTYAPRNGLPPGRYVVIVSGMGVPQKYQLTTTSGLTVEVRDTPSEFNIALL